MWQKILQSVRIWKLNASLLVTDYEAYIEACHIVVEKRCQGLMASEISREERNLKRQARGVALSYLVWVNPTVCEKGVMSRAGQNKNPSIKEKRR